MLKHYPCIPTVTAVMLETSKNARWQVHGTTETHTLLAGAKTGTITLEKHLAISTKAKWLHPG